MPLLHKTQILTSWYDPIILVDFVMVNLRVWLFIHCSRIEFEFEGGWFLRKKEKR